jgi:hypothetical protein
VVAEDADELAEVFLDQRMYAFTGGRPGTPEGLGASFARLQADQTAQRNWTVRRRADRQAVGMLQAVLAEDDRPVPGPRRHPRATLVPAARGGGRDRHPDAAGPLT